MQGLNKNAEEELTLSDITSLESPMNLVKGGHIIEYENIVRAVNDFNNSHKVPSEADLKLLQKEIDKKSKEEELDEKAIEIGRKLTSGIADNLKFTKVDGIGDAAYIDHLAKSLDVRFGTFSFAITMDTELDLVANIKIAKKIANEVLGKL
ncbi:hypothetical protein [Brumimicrobium mesophilum]|uniref:hypothetical protein n=1 Tax=Brumimicrobium mesophilum TaxID=392717 RepID=UPI000D13F644|nr:hypothetical protein [Brumimicrobium mesophilum]